MLRFLYIAVIAVCIIPTIPGILGVFSTAVGFVPAVGLHDVSLLGFKQVFQWEGVWRSIGLSFYTSILSSYLACLVCFLILIGTWQTKVWRTVEVLLSPLLAMPHVAFAIGFAFLFSPTGFSVRSISAVFDYSANQSDVNELATLIKDPYGLGLTLMLAMKEIPFLLLMSVPILQQLNVGDALRVSQSLGYSRYQAWWKVILPQWFTKLRFPMLAVLAYSLSVVDVALIIGPTNPPPFAVLVWQWFNEPDLSLLPRAAAGAIVLFVIASLVIGIARLLELALIYTFRGWQSSGRSGVRFPSKTLFFALTLLAAAMIPLIALWSVAQRWRFPDILPSRYSLRFWEYEWEAILEVLTPTIHIALISSGLALCLALVAHEYRLRYRLQVPGYVIAIPMLIPQLSVLFGMQVVTLHVESDLYFFWVCWAHVFFAFPYVYLALDGPWRSYNGNYSRIGLSLGKSPLYVWLRIKLPMLLPSVLFAWAVGMSVSFAQYLPTLVLGAGRISTITTEAVALTSGFDRRVTAIYALWQGALPLICFSLAILASQAVKHSRRIFSKGMITHDSLSQKPRHP